MTACISYVFYVRQCRILFYRGVHAPQGRIKGDTIVSPFPGLALPALFYAVLPFLIQTRLATTSPPRPLGGPGGLVVYTCCIYLLYIYLFNVKYAKTVDTAGNGLVCRQWECRGKSGKIY